MSMRALRRSIMETGASWAGGFEDGLVAGAPPRCPVCRRWGGEWATYQEWMGKGVRQSDRDRLKHSRALLLSGVPAVEESGVRKARDDQVYWCSRCEVWTYEPLVECGEGALPTDPDDLVVRGSHSTGDPERRFHGYVAAGEAGRHEREEPEAALRGSRT